MPTLEETLNLLPDWKMHTEIASKLASQLAEKAHSLQLENAVLKRQNSELLEKQQIQEANISNLKSEMEEIEEKNQENLEMIDSLKLEFRGTEGELQSKIVALQSEIAAKSHAYKAKQAEVEENLAEARFEASENEQKMKAMHELVLESKNHFLMHRASVITSLASLTSFGFKKF